MIHRVFQNRTGVGKGTLHFVEDNALIDGLCVQVLVPPALLAEDLRLMVDCRMEHRVQIDVHQIQIVFVVPGAEGVDRLIREGHGVQEGLNRGFQQLHKGLLHRVFVGTAQNRVLQNVENAGGILRDRFEGNTESLILLRPVQPAELCPGLVVGHLHQAAPQLLDLPDPGYLKSVQFRPCLHILPPP